MSIDFTRLQASHEHTVINPRDIFTSLNSRSVEFEYLRDVQGQVLDSWYERRQERDIVIKMNTGTGKTVVGLLALQSSMNEGFGPSLYAAPDNFLADQAAQQATQLGIPWTDDPKSTQYLSSQAIGIVNIYRIVNGRSIFGGPGSTRTEPVPIGSVVIDDAHACVNTVEQQTTVIIPNDHEAYTEILEIFRTEISKQHAALLADLEDQTVGVTIRVPIASWADHHARVMAVLQSHKDDDELRFTWPFVKDILPACQAIYSCDSLEIRPFCPPTNKVIKLEDANRHIFLTATLADESVLVTHFGVLEQAVLDPITPNSAADIGDRFILSPLEVNPQIDESEIQDLVRSLANRYNTVVLVPSYRRSIAWHDYADVIAKADEIADVVDRLKSSHVGLVVLVNKYDGIDLPDDACRILVVDNLPEALNNSERRLSELLGGSPTLAHRKLQKIEQGMGRGVRSARDYCVVLLLGSSLSSTLARPEMRAKLSPATRAQFDLSMNVAKQIQGCSIDDIEGAVEQCLNRDEGWLTVSGNCLVGVTYDDTGTTEPFSLHLRNAFEAACIGQYDVACEHLRDGIEATEDQKSKGWLQEQLATFMHPIDPVQAQQALAGAIRLNPRVLRPVHGVSYKRTPAALNQAAAAYSYLSTNFPSQNDLLLFYGDLRDRLQFDPERVNEFEDAVEELGFLLGFNAQRPEKEYGIGPDVLWSMGALKFLVIECKSGSISELRKRDMGQLSQSMSWFAQNYDNTCKATPMSIHHSGQLATDATPIAGMRILDAANLTKLCAAVEQYITSIVANSIFPSEETIAEALVFHGFTASLFVLRYSAHARQ
ncbi:DEAD/DEAH box helicase [Candidatus Poriferisocius sp.]|uniref:DEAD/DEAH box helicase n=1 Tax=Candidatus Poriferisocius sp. TaxID=3101276 RepID=UPI003B019AC4